MSAVKGIRNIQGLRTNVTGTHSLVKLTGPGMFVSAMLTKQGGSSDITFIDLKVDGNSLFNSSIAAIRNFNLSATNNYGIMVCAQTTGNDTVTIGFPFPIYFATSLELSVTVNESGVAQIIGNVVYGTELL